MATDLESLKEVLREAAKVKKEQDRFARYDDVVRFFDALTKVTKALEPTISDKLSKELSQTLKNEVQTKFGGAFSSVSEADSRFKSLITDITKREERIEKLVGEAKRVRDNDVNKVASRLEKECQKMADSCRKMLKTMQEDMIEYATIDDVTGFVDRALENHPKESIESIRDGLESLKGDERLDKSAIKGLEEELTEIRNIKSKPSTGGGITGRDVIQKYDLSPYLDGVTKVFAIPGNWTILDVSGTAFPYQFRRLIDYTFTSQQITFTDQVDAAGSLAAGQTVEILYVIG